MTGETMNSLERGQEWIFLLLLFVAICSFHTCASMTCASMATTECDPDTPALTDADHPATRPDASPSPPSSTE